MSSEAAHTSREDHDGQPEPISRHRSGINVFKRKTYTRQPPENANGGQEQDKMEKGHGQEATSTQPKKKTRGIQPDGESGRSWFHPWHFLRICWRSSSHMSKWTNVLWPFTIAAMVLYFHSGYKPNVDEVSNISLWVFILAYIGMVPAANLVGFAGQELARKIPKVAGVILETTFGSVVEIILFMVLIKGGQRNVPVIQAAILGSILANLLLCLGKSLSIVLTWVMLTIRQAHASWSAASSGHSRPSTKPSAKWVVILCSSLAWALSSQRSTIILSSANPATKSIWRFWKPRPRRSHMQPRLFS